MNLRFIQYVYHDCYYNYDNCSFFIITNKICFKYHMDSSQNVTFKGKLYKSSWFDDIYEFSTDWNTITVNKPGRFDSFKKGIESCRNETSFRLMILE